MKASYKYESLAQVLALVGALALGCGGFPCLNPIQFKLTFGEKASPILWMGLGVPAALLTLFGAWYFTSKAKRLKREEQEHDGSREFPQ
jgi:hypothetical protein